MSNPETPNYRLMDTNAEARESIATLIASARQELMIFDRTPITLRERDLGTPAAIDHMRSMLLGGKFRKIRIALQEVQGLESELPRLILLLGQFGGQVMIHRVTGAARQVEDVLMIADGRSVWRKPVYSHPRSVMNFNDEISVKPYVERFEEIWGSSELAVHRPSIRSLGHGFYQARSATARRARLRLCSAPFKCYSSRSVETDHCRRN